MAGWYDRSSSYNPLFAKAQSSAKEAREAFRPGEILDDFISRRETKAKEDEAKRVANKLEGRQDIEWGQKQDAVAKKLAGEKALNEFVANPNLYKYANKDIQQAADSKVIEQFESGKMKGLLDTYNSMKDQKEADAFYMKEIDPLNRKLQDTYENAPVYKEGVTSGVFQDLLKSGVDAGTADAISKRYAGGFSSIKDLQAAQDTAAVTAFKNNLERAKVLKDLSKDDRTAAIKEYEYFSRLTPSEQASYVKSRVKKDSSGGSTLPTWAKTLDEGTWLDWDREKVRGIRNEYIKDKKVDSKVVDKALNEIVPMFASDGKVIAESEFAGVLNDRINELNKSGVGANLVSSTGAGGSRAIGPDKMTKGIVDLLTPVASKNVRKVASDKLLGEIDEIFGIAPKKEEPETKKEGKEDKPPRVTKNEVVTIADEYTNENDPDILGEEAPFVFDKYNRDGGDAGLTRTAEDGTQYKMVPKTTRSEKDTLATDIEDIKMMYERGYLNDQVLVYDPAAGATRTFGDIDSVPSHLKGNVVDPIEYIIKNSRYKESDIGAPSDYEVDTSRYGGLEEGEDPSDLTEIVEETKYQTPRQKRASTGDNSDKSINELKALWESLTVPVKGTSRREVRRRNSLK